MEYKKTDLFGRKQSRGTFDDFFSTEKYTSLQEAYNANDYVECDFVIDTKGTKYIEARNVSNPDTRLYHQLNYQHCPAGLDVSDDAGGCEIANKLL